MKSARNLILWLVAAAAVMVLLPLLAVTLVKGDGSLAVCFLLFYVVNPLFSIAAGAFAGLDWKRRWILPAASAVLFLAGVWAFFDLGETAFLVYAGVYLMMGLAAMGVTAMLRRKQTPSS